LVQEQRSLPVVEALLQDLRFGGRLLRKSPVFAVVSVLTLALGIGATTAIFSVVYGVLLRPLPYHNPQQIVRLWEQSATGTHMNFGHPNFMDVRAQSQTLSALASFVGYDTTITGSGNAARVPTASVSRDFLQVMGVQPVFGRAFSPDEQRPDAPTAALVSYAYWMQTLGGTRDFSALHLEIDKRPVSIVGVLPPGFGFPDNTQIWVSSETYEESPARNAHNDRLVGRLKDGASVKEARAELITIAQRLKQQYGPDTDMVAVAIEPLQRALTNDVRPALLVLLGASAFLLLIACANVANLMLAQAAAREKELAVRTALGAQRTRLVRQFLTEALLISSIGGLLGVLFAYWGLHGLVALVPKTLPNAEAVSVHLPVLLFSMMVVFLVAIALATFTALRSTARDSRDALGEGSRGNIGSRNKQRVGRVLAAVQLGAALILLVGATLLGRSLLRVLSVSSGFRTENVVTMELHMPFDAPRAERAVFLNRLLADLRQIPGVDEVGGTNNLPLSDAGFADGSFVLMGATPQLDDLVRRSSGQDLTKMDPAFTSELVHYFDGLFLDKSHLGYADFIVASSGFFQTLTIPLLEGRLFDERDTIDAPHAAVISQSLAQKTWPNQNPVGRTIEFGNMDGDLHLLTVVGVVGDVRDHSLEDAPHPTVYVDYRQRPQVAWDFTVVMHTTSSPEATFAAARSVLHGLDPNLPPRFHTLSEVYSSSLDARRFSLTLVGIFSAVAFLIALAGVYGVISYSVAQRTREIGVRMALGATAQEVLAMVLKQGAFTGLAGTAVGLLGAFAVTRWLQSQLFEVSPTDPLTLATVSLALLLVSLAACWVPARRATRIDPVTALRCE
jgi:putative ABC transport system permease protein